ncbi:hypothetical protein BDN71DRAFT_287162 [Pleurotus eryngii]|uniref:Uncharacterized protein n=1 Tax=Pleurotus eryngii TaxID=5323 RepID=A0A9P6D273_PLEER|nr:hypothetical protein BDN71DRAFT_287162 [Pleurotus eryngii]
MQLDNNFLSELNERYSAIPINKQLCIERNSADDRAMNQSSRSSTQSHTDTTAYISKKCSSVQISRPFSSLLFCAPSLFSLSLFSAPPRLMAFSFRLGACLAILAALLHVTVATAPKTGPSSCQKTEFWYKDASCCLPSGGPPKPPPPPPSDSDCPPTSHYWVPQGLAVGSCSSQVHTRTH